MIGALIGDIVGSIYEFDNIKKKDFPLFSEGCFATDDSIMSLAVADALLNSMSNYLDLSIQCIHRMKNIGRRYPKCGFGGHFRSWILGDDTKPYGSYGNGAAMRISAVGYMAKSMDEVRLLCQMVTKITHNHPEGIKGAEATAIAIYLARQGKSKADIRAYITEHYYDVDFALDDIRDSYEFDETCQGTVPQAIVAFLESDSFEDCIRNAISIGGDSDTLACIAGGMAEAYYGVPEQLRIIAYQYFAPDLLVPLQIFEKLYCGYDGEVSFATQLAIDGSYSNKVAQQVEGKEKTAKGS